MARLTSITSKNQVAAKDHAIVDGIVQSRGALQGPFTMFLHCPELAGPPGAPGRLRPLRGLARHARARARRDDRRPRARRGLRVGRADRAARGSRACRRRPSPRSARSTRAASRPRMRRSSSSRASCIRKHRVDDATARRCAGASATTASSSSPGAIGYYSMLAMTVNACELEAAPGAEVLQL